MSLAYSFVAPRQDRFGRYNRFLHFTFRRFLDDQMRARHVLTSFFCVASVLFIPSFGAVRADTLSGTGGNWQNWTQTQLFQGTSPTPGIPYWNNDSGDGVRGNVGWCLTGGSSVCTMAGSPGAALPYFGTAAAGPVANVSFTSAGTPLTLSLAAILTDETLSSQFDVFGYYVVPVSGLPTLVPLFSTKPGGSQAVVGSTATLNLAPGTNYGFYVENSLGAGGPDESDFFFYMNSTLNNNTFDGGAPVAGPDSDQHFAIFQTSNGYVVGDVDAFACTSASQQGSGPCIMPSQFDYNDLVVTVSPSPTPEPATFGLIGLSVIVLAGFFGRKRQTAA
ncbi:MAG TPA: PEP-CTERM sorting domain-containing protein [Bryobacteraceae bacterium]|nr:PEP-CTERM sorting domain-containing protein [Bryobacteraceae bacterium]